MSNPSRQPPNENPTEQDSELTSPTGQAAVAYAKRGWAVLPIWWPLTDGSCACGDRRPHKIGKHPVGPLVPHGVRDATTDETTIRRWWEDKPEASVGIATGAVSGLVVVDVDPKSDGPATLSRLEAQYGSLATTPRVLTGLDALSGERGEHYYFRADGATRGTRFPGIDVQGDGLLVVAPPSRHVSGVAYEWDAGAHIDDLALALLPRWLASGEGRRGARVSLGTSATDERPASLDGEESRNLPVGRKARAFMDHGAPVGEQAVRAYGTARNFKSAGWSHDRAVAGVWEALQRCELGDPEWPWTPQDAVRIVRGVWGSPPPPLATREEHQPGVGFGDGTRHHPEDSTGRDDGDGDDHDGNHHNGDDETDREDDGRGLRDPRIDLQNSLVYGARRAWFGPPDLVPSAPWPTNTALIPLVTPRGDQSRTPAVTAVAVDNPSSPLLTPAPIGQEALHDRRLAALIRATGDTSGASITIERVYPPRYERLLDQLASCGAQWEIRCPEHGARGHTLMQCRLPWHGRCLTKHASGLRKVELPDLDGEERYRAVQVEVPLLLDGDFHIDTAIIETTIKRVRGAVSRANNRARWRGRILHQSVAAYLGQHGTIHLRLVLHEDSPCCCDELVDGLACELGGRSIGERAYQVGALAVGQAVADSACVLMGVTDGSDGDPEQLFSSFYYATKGMRLAETYAGLRRLEAEAKAEQDPGCDVLVPRIDGETGEPVVERCGRKLDLVDPSLTGARATGGSRPPPRGAA